jgi:hypothetical protein
MHPENYPYQPRAYPALLFHRVSMPQPFDANGELHFRISEPVDVVSSVDHVCSGHMASCDHCYRCDVLGTCCAGAASPDLTAAQAQPSDLERLRHALTSDQRTQSSIPMLLHADRSDISTPGIDALGSGSESVGLPETPMQHLLASCRTGSRR